MKNNKGFALPLVIFIVLILAVLMTGLLTTSVADVRHAVYQDNKIQANYLGRSAVDDIASYIVANKTAPSITVPQTKTFSYGEYTLNKIEATEGNNVYYIEATGKDGNATSTVGLTVSRDKPSDLFNNAIYTYNNLNIEGMKINGDIASLGTIDYSTNGSNAYDTSSYTAYPGASIDMTYSQFPISDAYRDYGGDDLDVGSDEALIADQNFNSITVVDNGAILRFNTGSAGNILKVGVINLTLGNQADIIVEGDGMLQLYVYGTLTSGGDLIVNDGAEMEILADVGSTLDFQTPLSVNPSEDPNKIRIYLDTNATLSMQANGNYNCYIFGPEAYIYMQSNGTVVNGSIIGNVLNASASSEKPNGSVNFVAPDDSWELTNPAYAKRFYQ